MHRVLVGLLVACEAASPATEVVEGAKTLPTSVAMPDVADVPDDETGVAELDRLPDVYEWLPPADRCDRHAKRRFCNGPRRAPVPQGESAERAERLGLGSHRAAAELIRTRPRPEWMAALVELGLRTSRKLVWPVDDGRFGRGLEFRGRRIQHRGIDFSAEVGTPVRAVADAMVGYADNTVRGYGNLLVLIHSGGEVSAYAHLSAIHVSPGEVIRAGQQVALAGNTGISRGPHLHMEWRENGEIVDPMPRFPPQNLPRWMRDRFAQLATRAMR